MRHLSAVRKTGKTDEMTHARDLQLSRRRGQSAPLGILLRHVQWGADCVVRSFAEIIAQQMNDAGAHQVVGGLDNRDIRLLRVDSADVHVSR